MGKIFMFHNFQNRKKYAQKYGNNKFRKEHFPPLWKLLQNVERWWRVDEQFLFHVSKLKWNPRKSIDASNRRKPFSHKPCLLGCAGWYMVLLFRLSVSLSFFKYLFMTHILFFDINNFLSAAREKKCIINVIYCMGEIFSLWKINRRPKIVVLLSQGAPQYLSKVQDWWNSQRKKSNFEYIQLGASYQLFSFHTKQQSQIFSILCCRSCWLSEK